MQFYFQKSTAGRDFPHDQRKLLRRFWQSASGFWRGRSGWRVWLLCLSLFGIVVAQLAMQYRLNYWNRNFFNALEQKEALALGQLTLLFFGLAGVSTALAVFSVWARMTLQRQWRRYLTRHLIKNWLANGRYALLGHLNGSDNPRNPEYRIAEDARIATDAPIDLVISLFSSILTVFVFFDILAGVGGALAFELAGQSFIVPAYLAIGVVAYSGFVAVAMLLAGRQLTGVVQEQVQAEAGFRAAANLIRENGDGILVTKTEPEERRTLWVGLHNVIKQWRNLCWQLMRTTLVTHGNMLLAPIIGLLLCVPKYLGGTMSLGEVTQAAAAFATVQGAFNWFVDNFQRMADWRAAANRVAVLLFALDVLKQSEPKSAVRTAQPDFSETLRD